jgi:[phosphatase 2A protein]-leucine-carboxy methyltransferase
MNLRVTLFPTTFSQTNLYPRTSIDSSRKVRQLAHSLQGYLVLRTGKRIARHLPRVVGSWLAGQYDNDKQVQRAAQESIATAFATEEKRIGIWKVYQSAILDFVVDALLQQTPQTLSDERTVRPDEADAKYARVVGTGILVFSNLLGKLQLAIQAPIIRPPGANDQPISCGRCRQPSQRCG